MKILLLSIAVFFHVQPAVAGACEMAGEMPVQQQVHYNADQGHDCCADPQDEPEEGCGHGGDCSTCTAGVMALAVTSNIGTPVPLRHAWADASRADVPKRSFPLFKPPIS